MTGARVEQLAHLIFSERLLNSGKRLTPIQKPVKIRLDRNESAYELSSGLKNEVLKKVGTAKWKNYPTPYYNELEKLIADYCGVSPEQIVPGAGSASIITSLLNYFAINLKQIVIAHPSFSLYEYHCSSYGIPYELWRLDEELEYEIDNLPGLKSGGIVLFASPNNPVGNVLSPDKLEQLLKKYPDTFFLVDEVYSEFCDNDNVVLLERHPNLLLLRSFSKTFSAAGMRVGYLIANELLAGNFRKLILPFTLNAFAENFAKTLLSNPLELKRNKENIARTISERERLYQQLNDVEEMGKKFRIYPSKGNFLLLQFFEDEDFKILKKMFEERGVKVLDLSNVPTLANSIRITVGNHEENNTLISLFKTL